ncbi:MAG: hypothetical protein HYT90_06070 [Candidatus Omnitrophica bacterium]|nr:hypothetical protein [Candidatus Omnitrophota bacterium]
MIGHGIGLLLVSVVAGYWVLERAETHKGDLRRVGKALGWLIIVASLIGIGCRVWGYATCPPGAMGKKGFFCPFMKPSSATAVTPAEK